LPFSFWLADKNAEPLPIPAIGLELRVRLPGAASGGEMTVIETLNAPGTETTSPAIE
jgi:hypothetical protein